MLTNADRELVARGAQTTPIADAQRTRNLAQKRLADAKKAKADADKAAVDEAAKPGLQGSLCLDASGGPEHGQHRARGRTCGICAAKIPESPTALATNLGVEQWQWDLFIAALRSGMIAAGALALGIAIHPSKKATAAAADAVTLTRKEMPARPVSQAVTTLARPMNRREHVSQFLSAVIRSDESSGASLRALHSKYAAWSPSQKPKNAMRPGVARFMSQGNIHHNPAIDRRAPTS